MEVSGIEEEIDDFIESWLKYVIKECANDAYFEQFDLAIGEIEGIKNDIETLKTKYHERAKIIKEKIFEDIALEINSISEESIDRSIAYWESADGQMFKTTIAVASEKINAFLPDACNAAIQEIVKNIAEESPSQLGLLFSDN